MLAKRVKNSQSWNAARYLKFTSQEYKSGQNRYGVERAAVISQCSCLEVFKAVTLTREVSRHEAFELTIIMSHTEVIHERNSV